MTCRVAINGFGRIGRRVLRAWLDGAAPNVDIVAINDPTPPETLAHLLAYDSVHGPLARPGAASDIRVEGSDLCIGTHRIPLIGEKNPADLPWRTIGVDVVMECTGLFRNPEKAGAHLTAGAKRVLISAPGDDIEKTVVYGVNHKDLTAADTLASNASCTTNCLAPVAKVISATCGLVNGFMTTAHAYTADQRLQDAPHSDLRRARAAALSMIPTSTGAAKAVGLVLPELKGKLDGYALRVPTPNVSVVDLTFTPEAPITAEDLNAAFAEAAAGPLNGVLVTNEAPLVSVDFNGHPASSVIDLTQTRVLDGGRLVKVLSWYDNESGFSYRMLDVATYWESL